MGKESEEQVLHAHLKLVLRLELAHLLQKMLIGVDERLMRLLQHPHL